MAWINYIEEIVRPLLAADAKDWDRLEEHLAKDTSGHGKWWLEKMREVRQAIESERSEEEG